MARRARGLLGGACGGAIGAALALVFVLVLMPSAEHLAVGAGPSGPDAGVMSALLVLRAQRGEVEPPDVDDVEHMCALLTSCERLPIPPSLVAADFSSCVKSLQEEMTSARAVNFSLLLRECGLRSNSCASLATCALRGVSPDACSGRGKQGVVGFCDGDGRAVSCWHDQVLSVRDCPRGHEECLVVDGEARCSLGSCPSDVREGDKPRCSASQTHLLHCEKGKLASLDCGAFGLKCGLGPDGAAGCVTGGPACAANAKRCEGNTAIGCYNGHEVRVDCTAAGLVCGPGPGSGAGTPVGACSAPTAAEGECDSTAPARCDGANIRYCDAGKPRSYSCRSFGFGKCEAIRAGVHCAPARTIP